MLQGFFYVLLAWISVYNQYNMKQIFALLLLVSVSSIAQNKPKMVAECTLEFSVSVNGADHADNAASSSLTLYIKGQQSRLDFVNPSFRQVKYYDAKTKSA